MFIVFEGIDGSGKTTQSKLLVNKLQNLNYKVIYTREPGGTKLADKIRKIVLYSSGIEDISETLLFTAARYDHYIKLILPSLLKNKIVVCDRFIASTLAYQSNNSIENNLVLDLNKLIFSKYIKNNNILIANITFFLDVPLKTAISRMKNIDNFEKRGVVYYERVIENYYNIRKKPYNMVNYHIIDASNNVKDIHENISSILKDFMEPIILHP